MYTVIFKGEEWLFESFNRAKKVATLLSKRGYKYVRVFTYPFKELKFRANSKDKVVAIRNSSYSLGKETERFDQPIECSDATSYKSEHCTSRMSLLTKPKKKVKRTPEDHKRIMALLEKRGQLSLDLFPRR